MTASVLAYHGVEARPAEQDPNGIFTPPDVFEEQMAFLARRRNVVTLDELLRGTGRGRPSVAITFDDGFRSVLTEAAPILERFGFRATVFVPTAWIGKSNEWDAGGNAPIMSAEELVEARSRGIDVQSHGDAHVNLAQEGYDEAVRDLTKSSDRLEALLGERPRFVAYPWGASSDATTRAAEAVGFTAGFTINTKGGGAFARARVPVTPLDSGRLFALKTSGRYLELRWSAPVRAGYAVVRPAVRALFDRSRA
jgi:peptidoglycan/xylan/chitin deacetylase (PgdA/CDA1 family)